MEETHRSVEHIISEIQNPDLDSSLEDIQAMVDNADLGERVGDTREGDLVTPVNEQHRVSPEFARAAGLLDRVNTRHIVLKYKILKTFSARIKKKSLYLIFIIFGFYRRETLYLYWILEKKVILNCLAYVTLKVPESFLNKFQPSIRLAMQL